MSYSPRHLKHKAKAVSHLQEQLIPIVVRIKYWRAIVSEATVKHLKKSTTCCQSPNRIEEATDTEYILYVNKSHTSRGVKSSEALLWNGMYCMTHRRSRALYFARNFEWHRRACGISMRGLADCSADGLDRKGARLDVSRCGIPEDCL